MATCVSESAHLILFITAIIITVIALFFISFSFDRFNKLDNEQLTKKQISGSRTVAMVGMILLLVSIAVLFVVFFGFGTRYVGVSATVPA